MYDYRPVVYSEIGDTWVDTPPSDPLLAAQFRALMRARRACTQVATPALCNGSDTSSAFYNFSRFLIKNIEHDWCDVAHFLAHTLLTFCSLFQSSSGFIEQVDKLSLTIRETTLLAGDRAVSPQAICCCV